MTIQKDNMIGKTVAENYKTASVFKKYGLDFCCQGNRTIEEACTKKEVDTDALLKDLNDTLVQESNSGEDYNSWPLDLLADYIQKKHHSYVEAKIREISPYLNKVCRVHGTNHPELLEIQEKFIDSATELTHHMHKEENILFPYIRRIVKSQSEESPLEPPHFGTVQNPISMMMDEHDAEGQRFRDIAKLSNNYTAPPEACNTYRVTYALLQEFEEDLHKHIHLENNILFPQAIKLEKELSYA